MKANKIFDFSQDKLNRDDIFGNAITNTFDRENIDFLEPLSSDYKNIENWYFQKVSPGLARGTRKLLRIESNGRIVAMGIAKKEDEELKICTVRVLPEYAGKGIGVKIFRELMNWLGTELPIITVSQEKALDFERIFAYFGFQLTSSHLNLYRTGMVEYFYNEPMLMGKFFKRFE